MQIFNNLLIIFKIDNILIASIWMLWNNIFNDFNALLVFILSKNRISKVCFKVCKIVLIFFKIAFILYRKILEIRKGIWLKFYFRIFYFFSFLIYDASCLFFSQLNCKLLSFWKHIFIFIFRQDEIFRILVSKVKVLMIHFNNL